MKKFRVSVSTAAYIDLIIERESDSGEGWSQDGWPRLTMEEKRESAKLFGRSCEVEIPVAVAYDDDEISMSLDVEEVDEWDGD